MACYIWRMTWHRSTTEKRVKDMIEHTHSLHSLRRGAKTALVLLGVTALTLGATACSQAGIRDTDPSTSPSASESTSEANGSADSGATGGTSGAESSKGMTSGQVIDTQVLPKEMSGQEAIDALGDDIGSVAKKAGKSVDELKALLLRDASAHVTPQGFVVYRD